MYTLLVSLFVVGLIVLGAGLMLFSDRITHDDS